MLNEEICKKREELNSSIINKQDYEIIYKLSVELDDLIADHYRRKNPIIKNNRRCNNSMYNIELGALV